MDPLRLKALASHTAEVPEEKDCKNTSTSHTQTQEAEPAIATRRKRLHWLHGAQEEGAICNERPPRRTWRIRVGASMSAVHLQVMLKGMLGVHAQAYAQSARPSIKGWRFAARTSRASEGTHHECKCNESKEAQLISRKQLFTVTLRKRKTADCSTNSVVCNSIPSEKGRLSDPGVRELFAHKFEAQCVPTRTPDCGSPG